MSKIFKMEITTAILIQAADREEASERLANLTLSEIADEMDSGDLIGQENRGNLVEVPRAEVESELEAMGNDGTFFVLEDEDGDNDDGED